MAVLLSSTSSWFAAVRVFCDLACGCGPCTACLAGRGVEVCNDDSAMVDSTGHKCKISILLKCVLSFHTGISRGCCLFSVIASRVSNSAAISFLIARCDISLSWNTVHVAWYIIELDVDRGCSVFDHSVNTTIFGNRDRKVISFTYI